MESHLENYLVFAKSSKNCPMSYSMTTPILVNVLSTETDRGMDWRVVSGFFRPDPRPLGFGSGIAWGEWCEGNEWPESR